MKLKISEEKKIILEVGMVILFENGDEYTIHEIDSTTLKMKPGDNKGYISNKNEGFLTLKEKDLKKKYALSDLFIMYDKSKSIFYAEHDAQKLNTRDVIVVIPLHTVTYQNKLDLQLLEELNNNENLHHIQKVKQLENKTILTPESQKNMGSSSASSAKGYNLLIKLYIANNRHSLTSDHIENFTIIYNILKSLGDDELIIRENKNKKSYVDNKLSVLEKTGRIALLSGGNQHHAFVVIEKIGSKYYISEFNAGYNAKRSGIKVKGSSTYEIIQPTPDRIRRLIEEYYEIERTDTNKTRQTHDAITKEYLGTEVNKRLVTPQGKGNCTTRSNRELIRYIFPENLFIDFLEYIRKKNNFPYEKLKLEKLTSDENIIYSLRICQLIYEAIISDKDGSCLKPLNNIKIKHSDFSYFMIITIIKNMHLIPLSLFTTLILSFNINLTSKKHPFNPLSRASEEALDRYTRHLICRMAFYEANGKHFIKIHKNENSDTLAEVLAAGEHSLSFNFLTDKDDIGTTFVDRLFSVNNTKIITSVQNLLSIFSSTNHNVIDLAPVSNTLNKIDDFMDEQTFSPKI